MCVLLHQEGFVSKQMTPNLLIKKLSYFTVGVFGGNVCAKKIENGQYIQELNAKTSVFF